MHYLYTDGGSRGNPGNSGIACFIFDENKNLIDFNAKFIGVGTNNNAEYLALKLGLTLAIKCNITELTCNLDSELAVKQINGQYKVSSEEIKKHFDSIKLLCKQFKKITFNHVPRNENKFADKLVNLILDTVENNETI